VNEQPIYSPSQVQNFEFCQQFWAFQRDGWVPRVATRKLQAAIFSIAGHAGLAFYHRRLLDGNPFVAAVLDDAVVVACQEYLAEIDHYLSYGVNFGTLDVAAAQGDLCKLLQKYHSGTKDSPPSRLLAPGWKVLDVEHEFPEWGNARVDLIAQDPDGFIVPVDFKIKRKVKAEWFDMQGWLDEFKYTSKQVHYMLALEAERNQPVTRHYVYGITCAPWDHQLAPFDLSEYYKQSTLDSLKQQWCDITFTQGHGQYALHPTHRNQYGECEMVKACTTLERDPAMMALDYVKVPRRKETDTDA